MHTRYLEKSEVSLLEPDSCSDIPSQEARQPTTKDAEYILYTCMYTYTHTYPHPHPPISTHTNTHIHAHIHTYIHTRIHACIHAYIHTYIHTHIHTYLRSPWIQSVSTRPLTPPPRLDRYSPSSR